MFPRRLLCVLFAVGVLIAATIVSMNAQAPVNSIAYLTFTAPVLLPGASLGVGTYLFELADPLGDSSLVRVSSRDGSKVYYTGFTQLMPRPPRGRSEPLVSFGEAAPGMPVPIAVWYPRDDPSGRRFVYRETERTTAARSTATR
jgi:hypothetical protein